jgi:hypothetical protein
MPFIHEALGVAPSNTGSSQFGGRRAFFVMVGLNPTNFGKFGMLK